MAVKRREDCHAWNLRAVSPYSTRGRNETIRRQGAVLQEAQEGMEGSARTGALERRKKRARAGPGPYTPHIVAIPL